MPQSLINRRDALVAGAGLAITATAPSPTLAQTPPQPTTASAILKSQSLAPLMGAPVEFGRAANGAIVNKAALDAHAKTFPPREETVKVADNIWVLQNTSVTAAFIVGTDGVIVWESGDKLQVGKA
jgi:hypothetical protein